MPSSTFAGRLAAASVCAAFASLSFAQAATIVRPVHGISQAAPSTPSITITAEQRALLLEEATPTAGKTLWHKALAGFTDIHDFSGPDGQYPQGALLQGLSGSLYGETQQGGANALGVLFKSGTTAQTTTFTTTHSFGAAGDGATPSGGLRNVIGDVAIAGYLYGVTTAGGANGDGAIFRVDASGNESVVYSFTGAADGANPTGRLIAFVDGNYYGTTSAGASGYGTVFQFNPFKKTLKTLHAFTGGNDGGYPLAGLSIAVKGYSLNGNLFGVTSFGGSLGNGTIFAISPSGAFASIYAFGSAPDASSPGTELVPDCNGKLYGTSANGGTAGVGAVYETDVNGHETILHDFPTDGLGNYLTGANPLAPLSINYATGILYGTASQGGDVATGADGVVFKLDPSKPIASNFTVLHTFGGADGYSPSGKLIVSWDGNLYGTANIGGANGVGDIFGLPIQ
jgi:uncharacterized repeat protein (TIGR03803 family)